MCGCESDWWKVIFSFMCIFCRSLFVLLYFFFWPLRCLQGLHEKFCKAEQHCSITVKPSHGDDRKILEVITRAYERVIQSVHWSGSGEPRRPCASLKSTIALTIDSVFSTIFSVHCFCSWRVENNSIARNIVLNTTKYSGSSSDVPVPELVITDVDTTDAGLYQML
jgi:hypothetical protein